MKKMKLSPAFMAGKMKKQKGLTLVELSIALAIGAVITIVGIIFATDALKESRISAEAARMNSIVMKARAAFANTAYANLDTGANTTVSAAQLGVFPKDMLNNAAQDPSTIQSGEIINRWGGEVVLGRDSASRLLRVVYPNIPREDCVEFVNRVEALFSQIAVDDEQDPIGSASIKNTASGIPNIDVDTLATAGCVSESNTLTFAFRK